jgi:DNA-binding XRE family transcriptional regulator/ribosomal protein S27AE
MQQIELARRIGISGNALNQIERGGIDPRASRIKAIADVLDVSADYLLGRDVAAGDGRPLVAQLPSGQTRRRTTAARRPVARTNGHTPVAATADADTQPARMCPHCGTNMQPLDDGARLTCPGCHYTVAEET